MEHMFPLSCLKSLSLRQQMNWDLTRVQSSVSIGRISNRVPVGYSRDVIGLIPDSLRQEYPNGETLKQVGTFISKFIEVKGYFSKSEFRLLGWVHSTEKAWWARMVGFVLKELRGLLVQSGLYLAVRVVQYSIPPSHFHFFAILERYNPDSCTFFTPRERWGFPCTKYIKFRLANRRFALWRIHPQYRRTSSDEEGCPAGLRDLLGGVMSLSYCLDAYIA